MKTGKRYFIVYDGNLTGAEYHNDIIVIPFYGFWKA